MAGGNLGDLNFTLSVKSKLDKQMQDYESAIKKVEERIKSLKGQIESAKANKDVAGLASLRDSLKEARGQLKNMQSNAKGFETRMQGVLDKAHDFDALLKSFNKNAKNLKIIDPDAFEAGARSLQNFAKMFRELWRGGLESPFSTNQGFKTIMGESKRNLSDTKKEITAYTKEVTNAMKKAANDEQKAATYYVTRKQRVDDAIQAMYDRRANLAARIKSAPDYQKAQLQGVLTLINQVIARLSNAKALYEQVQDLQAKGYPAPRIKAITGSAGNKSETYLGRYTGMSELFGGDIKKGQVPYNYVTSLYNNVMGSTATPFGFQERIANARANARMEIAAQKEIQKEEQKTIQGIDDTKVRYRELQRIFSEGLSVRRNSFLSDEERAKMTAGLTQLAEKLLNLRAIVQDGTKPAPYLFNTGDARNQIKDLQDLISLYESYINARKRADDKSQRDSDRKAEKNRRDAIRNQKQTARDEAQATKERGQAAQTELNRQQRIIDMRNREEKALDATTKRYIQLFDVLKSLQSVRSDRLGLGGDVTKLDAAIANLLPKVRELHDAAYSGRTARSLYNSAASQRDIDLAKQLAVDEAKVNKELERQAELRLKNAEAEKQRNADIVNKTLEKTSRDRIKSEEQATRAAEQREKVNERAAIAEQRQIDATIERYAKLFSLLREGLSVSSNSNRLGQDAAKLNTALQGLMEKVAVLRGAVGRGEPLFNLFDKGQDKVEIENLRQLIKSYEALNKEAEKVRQAQREQVAAQRQAAEASVLARAKFLESQRQMMATAYSQGKGVLNAAELDQVKTAYQAITNELRTLQTVIQNLSSYSIRDLFAMGHSNSDYSTVANNVKDRVAQEERYQQRINDLIAQRQHASEQAAKNDKERIAQQEAQFNSLEAKMRQVAAVYGQLRTERNNTARLGGNTTQLDAELQHLREIFTQLNSLRWGRGGTTGTMAQTFMEADNAIQKVNADIKKAHENVVQMETSVKNSTQAARDLASAFDRVHNSAHKTSQVVSDLKSLFLQGGLVYSVQSLVNNIIQTGGQIEQQHIALRSMIGDMGEADKLFGQIKELAVNSPFTFSEMIRDTKQLVAFGVETQNIYDTTKRLADISAGLGVSFERLGLAFGQVKSRGWLDGKELRQFAYAGLPLLAKLSALYSKREGKTVSTSDVRTRITKRNVPFEDVKQVLWDLTDAGGQFYNMQDALTNTLLGKYNKLKDAWDIMLSGFTEGGNVVGNVFKGILDALAAIIQNMDILSPMLVSSAAFFGGKRALGMVASSMGLKSISGDLAKAQRLQMQKYAAAQMEDVLQGKISQKEMTQNMLKRQQLYTQMQQNGKLYAMLAVQGSLKPMELASVLNNKGKTAQVQRQNAELVRQLQLLGIISAREGTMVLNGNRFGLAMNSIGKKLGSVFNFGNIATAALAAVGAIWASANEIYERNEQKGKEAAQSAATAIKNVQDQIDAHGNKPLTSAYIGNLQDVLKQSHLYTTSMDDQINRATTLAQKYGVIKKAIEDARFVQEHGKLVGNALSASQFGVYDHWWEYLTGNRWSKNGGDWLYNKFFNDSIQDNIQDLREAETAFNDLKRTGNATAEELKKAKDKVSKAWNEIATDDVPKMVRSIQKDLMQTGKAWKNLANGAKRDFVRAMNQIVEAAGVAGTQIGERLFSYMWVVRAHPNWLGDPKKMQAAFAVYGRYYRNNFTKWQTPETPVHSETGNKNKSKNYADRYLKARQKEANAIQAYYHTWDKWRKVEGDDAARRRVANDSRFSAEFRSKYPNPEDIAENYVKLANAIHATTDERKQYVQELKSKAAEKEAQIEYEQAQRLNNIFKEQLDNLSKRYEWYERLAKVAGRETAGGIAFGNQSHSESYYSYLKQRLSDLQNGTVHSFVENGGVNGTAPEVTITANAPKVDFSKYGGLEGVMALPDEDVLAKFGTNVSNLIKALKAQRDKLDSAIVDSLEQGYSYYQDYEAEIDAINKKYDERIARLKERNQLEKDNKDYISNESLQQQTTVLRQQQSRDTAAVNYKKLQQSDVYTRFFGATFLLSTKGAEFFAKTIRDRVTEAFDKGAISADEYANKINEINEQLNSIKTRRSAMFTYLTEGFDGLINQQRSDGEEELKRAAKMREDANRLIKQSEITPGQEGVNLKVQGESMLADAKNIEAGGQAMVDGANNAANTVAIIDKIANGINDNVQKLKALMDDITDTIETFAGSEHADNFRNSKGYAFVSGFSNASQGATDAWNSLKSGNVMGVLEGGYRSIIGWATPWAKRHDAKLDKQIQTAERTNKLIDSMRSSIERRLQNSLGGVYGYTSQKRDIQKIKDGLDNYSLAKTGAKYGRNTVAQSAGMGAGAGALAGTVAVGGTAAIVGATSGLGAGATAGLALGSAAGPIGAAIGAAIGAIVGGLFGHKKKKYKTNYSEDTYEAMVKADQTQAYYDQMYASYRMQKDNLEAQMKAEQKKKSKDKDKIADYKSQIEELDDKIQTFATDMAKSLYDIDLKSWAKELTDAVVSAWAAGENAVDAYRDKVKDLMRTLATNIISQKIMEMAFEKSGIEDFIAKEMDAKSGKLDDDDIVAIANMLDTIGDSTIPSIVDLMEKLKDKGWDLSDTDSASMSSSIQGLTETTGDIMSAYMNAMRADLSVLRQLQGSILPQLNITASAQLQQQTMIAQNTLRNADAAQQIQNSTMEILTIFRAVTNDTKRINVNTH